ncbi:MAG: T9SS type A sorting domain-containing protein [bacterium]
MYFITISFAQAPDTLWTRAFGDAYRDQAFEVQQTSDGGYIMCGFLSSTQTWSYNVYLIKTDSLGNKIWAVDYGGADDDIGYSVCETSDGGYIASGSTMSFGVGWREAFLLRLNANGDTLWTKSYGWTNAQNTAYTVRETPDSCFLLVGSTIAKTLLIKTDTNGDTLWLRELGMTHRTHGYSADLTSDGGCLIGGVIYRDGHYDFHLMKVNSFGDSLWALSYGGGATDEHCYCIRETSDGGCIAVGGWNMFDDRRASSAYAVKTDSNGIYLWERTYGGGLNAIAHAVEQTEDGGFIITGYTSGIDYYDVYLIRTDPNGDTLWTTTIGGQGTDWGHSVSITPDHCYVIAGWTTAFGAGNRDAWLIKTEPDLYGIEEKTLRTKKYDFTPTIVNGPLQLPEDKNCRVFDITGRVVMLGKIKPGIYFIELDGKITQKVIKIR